ncbi:MAG: SDR family oxidoreductase [Gammaproteobacteria bacterium]|nr:SDR family oxidoreductase [Gammaproteobacteria bacterium]
MRTNQRIKTGRAYLLTGATGFLGKVLLEELLRQCEEFCVEQLYVLIRPRRGLSAEERFWREVVPSDCFSRLPPDWTERVVVLEGHLERPGLDLDQNVRDEITRRVTHVLHSAASVDFDMPLAKAAQSNIATSLNLQELARSCSRLRKFVCVSTAYASLHPGEGTPIEEKLAPLPWPAEEIYRSILDGNADEDDLLSRSGHPNTYTLTKSLAEHLLVARRGAVPLAIVRPSIISASWRHPFPGWIDSSAGFASFVILLGMGHMRAVVANPDAQLDLIPVDEVAKRVLFACQATNGVEAQPLILHAVAGLEHSATIRECWQSVRDFFSSHRVERRPTVQYMGPPGLRFALAHALHHRLAIAAAGLRGRGARRSGSQLLARLVYLNKAFPYFAKSFDFRSAHPLDDTFNPRTYVTTVSRGVYHHILGRDDTEWLLAGRRHQGHGGDVRWVYQQPHGSAAIRLAAWLITKVLRRCCERVTVDVPSFEAARRAALDGCPLVLLPTHRSYLDFVLCSYLFFARPDLRIPIPHIAAAIEFSHIPILGRLFNSLHAFYVKRGGGCEDKELAGRVHRLIREGKAIEFFIEGTRSRSREFLPPKRGLLRCIQATGETCQLIPVGLSYDRVPEEAAFAQELAGAPKPRMRLLPLLGWSLRVLRGQVDLGRVHIACGAPIQIGPDSDIHAVSHQVIERIQSATVSTTFHLRAFLDRHPIEGIDAAWLRSEIEQRGGRVLESNLSIPEDLDPLIASTLRHQFAHLFAAEAAPDEPLGRLVRQLFKRRTDHRREKQRVA